MNFVGYYSAYNFSDPISLSMDLQVHKYPVVW